MPGISSFTDETARLGMDVWLHISAPAGAFQNRGYNEPFQKTLLLQAVPDTTAPTIGNASPASGASVAGSTPITFDVTDAGGLLAVEVYASINGGSAELVHDSSGFASGYSAGSSRSAIANGYHYSLVRAAGWKGTVLVTAKAWDLAANASTVTGTFNAPAADTSPPTISGFSPVDGSTIDADEELEFDVADPSGVGLVFVYVSVDEGPFELAWDGSGPSLGYSVGATGGGTALHFSVTRDAGWFGAVSLRITAADALAQSTQDGVDYEGPEPPPPADVVAPIISDVLPLPGTELEADQPITFTVTDETGLALVAIWVELVGEDAPEVVFTGTRFSNRYAQGSSREAIVGGWNFTVFRKGGWPTSFDLEAKVLDSGGNEAVYQEPS